MEASTQVGIKVAKVLPVKPFDSGSEDSQKNRTLIDERPLRICVVFDEPASACIAEALITHVTPDLLCDRQTFLFDELSATNRNKAAARKVADMDILVLAARGDQLLPPHIRFWLGLCFTLRNENHEGALVALITKVDGYEGLHSSIMEYLETIAIIGGLAFFPRKASRPMTLKAGEKRLSRPTHTI
jgi:hypothetical protein